MEANPFYVIVDTVRGCLVLVRPSDETVEVVNVEGAAKIAGALVSGELGEATEQEIRGLTLPELAARLCDMPEKETAANVTKAGEDLGLLQNELVAAIAPDNVGGSVSLVFRADREMP